MPSLSFFTDERDIDLLVDRLNADPEVAFIVPERLPENKNAEPRRGLTLVVEDGELKTDVEPPGRWKAVRTVGALPDGRSSLWHIPAGPLPLIEVKIQRVLPTIPRFRIHGVDGLAPISSVLDACFGFALRSGRGTDRIRERSGLLSISSLVSGLTRMTTSRCPAFNGQGGTFGSPRQKRNAGGIG